MKKILIVLVMISFLFSSLVYGEVDGWKDYKFGMSEYEVKKLIPNSCKTEVSYEISTYNCLRIGNIKIPIVTFRFTSDTAFASRNISDILVTLDKSQSDIS